MIGLALAAKRLAIQRANEHLKKIGLHDPFPDSYEILSRRHGIAFWRGPTGHYYRIIDALSAGRAP